MSGQDPRLVGKFLIGGGSVTGHAPANSVQFPVTKCSSHSKECDLTVFTTEHQTLHLVALNADGGPIKTNWVILNASVIPDLILALQHLQAGPLGRVAVELDMDKA